MEKMHLESSKTGGAPITVAVPPVVSRL